MRILFLSRSGNDFEVLPFIERQFESLKPLNTDIEHYVIKGGGLIGYWRALKYLKTNKIRFDIIHAHYAYCFLPVLLSQAQAKKVISFMGSDLYGIIGRSKFYKYINIFLSKLVAYFADWIIVKSPEMKKMVAKEYHDKLSVIPNGIDLKKFKPIKKEAALEVVSEDLDYAKRYILFLGDKKDPRKNYSFIQKNMPKIKDLGFSVLAPYPVSPELVPYYINISELLVLPSLKEGSPNVIKETLACNKPFLSTDVGDVYKLIEYSNTSSIFSSSGEFISRLKAVSKVKHETKSSFYEDYSLSSIANRLLEIYKGLM